MEKSFPRKNYFISLVLHPSTNKHEWEFVKSTLITFEGMVSRKFKADGISYQEAPQIELHFPSAVKEDVAKYQDRIRIIRSLLKEYHENKGGLNYCLCNQAQPNLWAIDLVVWGIINKDDFRLK